MLGRALIVVAFVTGGSFSALGGESALPITPPGGTDVDQALLPPTGVYGVLVAMPYNMNQNFYGYDGKAPPSQTLKLQIPLTAAGLLYVYPIDVFGGRLASSVIFSYYDLGYQYGGTISGHQLGLADTYSDIFYWSKNLGLAGATKGDLPLPYGLNVAAGFAMKIPTGVYSASNFINIGTNFWLPIPNVSATYVTGPIMSIGDSAELSGRLFFGVPLTNPATGYTSGNVVDVDWSATERFGKLRFGAAGFYQTQVSDDNVASGAPVPHGGKFSYGGVGPLVEYDFANGVSVKGRYSAMFYERNFPQTNFFTLTVEAKLY